MHLVTPNSDTLGPTPWYNLPTVENADVWKAGLCVHICSVSSCITGRLGLWSHTHCCTDFASMVVSNVVKAEGCDNSLRLKEKTFIISVLLSV